jgi:ABC-type antimicrobial peptide transport system, ATPase component
MGGSLSQASDEERARIRRTKLGQVFQQFRLVDTLTAVENVMLGMELAGLDMSLDAANEALEDVGLGNRARHMPDQLSGGERQRVGIARAIIHEPPIVLADEPTGNLDRARAGQIFDLLLNRVEQSGASLVVVTHDPELAASCDTQLHLRGGKVQ